MSERYNEEDIQGMSLLDQLGMLTQTYDDAVAKYNKESGKKFAERMEMKKEGTYTLRVLPLMPIMENGKPKANQRVGYEYPIFQQFVKITGTEGKAKKEKVFQFPVIDVRQAFPELKEDLIETFVKIAKEKYPTEEKFIEKITSNSFEGGLKYDRQRAMYVLDMADEKAGIKLYTVSYPQYREIEDAKLNIWGKLAKKDPGARCPLSDPSTGYSLEVKRTKEGKKVKYSFSINTLEGPVPLTEDIVKKLYDLPRLPEALYSYRRFNLEATIEALKQIEDEWEVDVLSEPEVQDCIKAIEAVLPSDDTSHFSLNGKDKDEDEESSKSKDTLDDLWDAYEDLVDKGIGDRSPEGSELKTRIVEFIERNKLNTTPSRKTTIEELLNMIDDEMEGAKPAKPIKPIRRKPESEPEPEEEKEKEEEPESKEDEAEDNEKETDLESGPELEEEEERPSSRRREREERNDDTNEPAVQPARERRVLRRHGSNRR